MVLDQVDNELRKGIDRREDATCASSANRMLLSVVSYTHLGAHAEEERRHFLALQHILALELRHILDERFLRVRRLLEHTHPACKAVRELLTQGHSGLGAREIIQLVQQRLGSRRAPPILHGLRKSTKQSRELRTSSKALLQALAHKLRTVVDDGRAALRANKELGKLLVLLNEANHVGTNER